MNGQDLLNLGFEDWGQNWYGIHYDVKPNNHKLVRNSISINLFLEKTVLGSSECIHEAWNIHINHCKTPEQIRRLYKTLAGKQL